MRDGEIEAVLHRAVSLPAPGGNHRADDLVAVEQELDGGLIPLVRMLDTNDRAGAELDVHGVYQDLIGLGLGDQVDGLALTDVGARRPCGG